MRVLFVSGKTFLVPAIIYLCQSIGNKTGIKKTLCQTECGYVLVSYTTDTFVELKKFKTEDLCESGKPRPTLNLRLGYADIQEGY